tara:strand:- start:129 stop:4334 length:4206 start_codon:yes stop_codon:yes gene_type:complete
MPIRDDEIDGVDSLTGNTWGQQQFDFGDLPEDEGDLTGIQAEWTSVPLRIRFKIDRNNTLWRHRSEYTKSRKIPGKDELVGVKDTDIVYYDKQDTNSPPIRKTHSHEREQLMKAMEKEVPDIFENSAARRRDFKYRLNLLSLIDLVDINKKLYLMAKNLKRSYIADVQERLWNKEQDIGKKFTLDMGITSAPEGTPEGARSLFEDRGLRYAKRNIAVTDTSTGKPIRAKGSKTTWRGDLLEIAPYYSVAGDENSDFIEKAWFYKDENGNWKLFDGFKTVDGTIQPDSTRSDLLMQHGLISRYKWLAAKVANTPKSKIEGEPSVTDTQGISMNKFNSSYAPFPHIPSVNPKRAQDWFSQNSAEWEDSEGGMLGLSQLSDIAMYTLFNDLDNIDLDTIPEQIDFMRRNFDIPANHPSGLNNPELTSFMDTRNERGVSQPDEARYPHTGFMRVVDQKGNVVPYNSLTADEGADFRGHWSNLYDRLLGYLQFTKTGRKMWDEKFKEEMEHYEGQRGRDRLFAEKDFEELGMPIKGRVFTGEGPKDRIFSKIQSALKGRTIRSVSDELVKERNQIRELQYAVLPEDKARPDGLLTDKLHPQQVAWLIDLNEGVTRGYNAEEIHGSRIWGSKGRIGLDRERYQGNDAKGENAPPSIEAKRNILFGDAGIDYYRRRAEGAAEDYFIGQPIVKTAIDPETGLNIPPGVIYKRAEQANTNIARINGEDVYLDEGYFRRAGGMFEVDGLTEPEGDLTKGEDYQIPGRYTFKNNLTGELVEDVPSEITENTKYFAGGLSAYIGYTMMDKLVQDGIIDEIYGSPGTVRRTGANIPIPPKFGTPGDLERMVLLNTTVRQFLHLRGLDNESGLHRYEELQSDPDMGSLRFPYVDEDGVKHSHFLDVVYDQLQQGKALLNDKGEPLANFKYEPAWSLDSSDEESDNELNENVEIIDNSEDAENDPEADKASQHANDAVRNLERRLANVIRVAQEKGEVPDRAVILELQTKLERAKKAQLVHIEKTSKSWAENDEAFNEYRETVRNRHYSEILQNAPLNVRATAFRYRLDNLNRMLDEARTQGDLHNVARDWARTGLIEYKDILPIDKDGASKLQRIRRRLENTNGVDWVALDKEYTDINHTKSSLENLILGVKENIDLIEGADLLTKNKKEEDFTPEEWQARLEADARHSGFGKQLRGYERQLKNIPSYGSPEHIRSLRQHPATADAYTALDNTSIDSIDPSLYEGTKTAPNPIADAIRTGANAWTESRLRGDFLLTNFFQALTATIGDATGIGGDKLRGLDVTKPLDQHRADYGGSFLDWLRPVPLEFPLGMIPKVGSAFRSTVADARTKVMGREGKQYIPDPTMESEVYVGKEPTGVTYQDALEATDAALTTETPPYKAPVQQFGPEAETEEET